MAESAKRSTLDVRGLILAILLSLCVPAVVIGVPLMFFGARDLYTNNVLCGDSEIPPSRFTEVACGPSYSAGIVGDLESINQGDLRRQHETGRSFMWTGMLLLTYAVAVFLSWLIPLLVRKRRRA